jgi:aldose 1-epimerase
MSDRYQVTQDLGQYVLVDASSGASAAVDPRVGNNVTHFRLAIPGRQVPLDVLLAPIAPEGLGASGYGAGNPILFPFPNRVRGGQFTFQGRAYQLDINETSRGNHIHGLVSRLPWQIEAHGASEDEGAWVRSVIDLAQFPEAMRQYPFPCFVTVVTRLHEGVLIQDFTVRNSGQTALPMGFGTHPWFPASIDGGPREQVEIRIPATGYWELELLVPTGQIISADTNPEKFDLRDWHALDDNEYDDVFTGVIRRPDGWIEAGFRYPNLSRATVMEASPEFREWVLFAPKGRPVICLEPYTGTTNAVNLQNEGIDAGLVVLDPGQTWAGTIRISNRPG